MTSTTNALLDGLLDWVRIETHTPDTSGLNTLMDLVAAQAAAFGATSERIPAGTATAIICSFSPPGAIGTLRASCS